MLVEFEFVRNLAVGPDRLELAIWFHDAVYQPLANDNEEQSAALARKMLGNAMSEEVVRLIMLTKHSSLPMIEDIDGRIIVDCDLAILGAQKELFEAFELGIRKEYRSVPQDAYVHGRKKILNSFLARPRIYSIPYFVEKYEEQARRNLSLLIRNL